MISQNRKFRQSQLMQEREKLSAEVERSKSLYEQDTEAWKAALVRREELAQMQKHVRSQVDAHDISVEGALSILQLLEKEKIAAEIQCCATESRILALRKAIDGLSAKSQALIEQDKVLEKLKVIVTHHQQKIAHLRAAIKMGRNSVTEVLAAETELAEAELRILLREEDLRKGGSAEVLATFNRQLIELTVDHAEYEARRRFITERVREIRPLMKLIQEYRHLELSASAESVDELRMRLAERQHALQYAERQLEQVLRELRELSSVLIDEALERDQEKP